MTRKTVTVVLEGEECASSARAIEAVLGDVPGVLRAYANPVTEAAYVEYDAERCSEAELISAVESLGVRVLKPTRHGGHVHE